MSLKERLMDDLKTSMKEKLTLRKNTITMLRSRIKQYEVDNRLTADDDLIMQMIQKEIKERNDTLDSLKGTDRAELIKDTEEEISYLSEYLPKQMDDEELNDLVSAVVAEVGATSMKDMGAVMKLAKERSESRVDAKRLSDRDMNRFVELYSKFSNTTRMPCNRGYTPDEMMQMTPPEERFKSLSLGPNIRKSLQTGEMDIEDFRKQILTMELPSEAMRFDLLKQLADIKPSAPQPEKQKKVGRNDPCPCGSGKKYKRCCGK